jgi:hypothetical protein
MRSGRQRNSDIVTKAPKATTPKLSTTTNAKDSSKMADSGSKTADQTDTVSEHEGEPLSIDSLGRQMLAMGKTLESIDLNLTSLNTSVHNLETAKTELKDDFNKLRADINKDMENFRQLYDEKMRSMDNRITQDYLTKHTELLADLDTHKLTYDADIGLLKVNAARDLASLNLLTIDHDSQAQIIRELVASNIAKDERLDRLEALIQEHIKGTATNFQNMQVQINEAKEMANQVEAHERRWAIRIRGLQAPPKGKFESTPEAKKALLVLLTEKLNINNVGAADIDTAHRIGPVVDGKQTLLVRFFRREIVEHILGSKRLLKGKMMSIFQDTTQKNRQLMYELALRPEVESTWCSNGTVWVKVHSKAKKFKVTITEDIDKLLAKHPKPATSEKPREQRRKNPNTTNQEDETTLPKDVIDDASIEHTTTTTTTSTAKPHDVLTELTLEQIALAVHSSSPTIQVQTNTGSNFSTSLQF